MTANSTIKLPYLIQRVLFRDGSKHAEEGKQGVDALFTFDYMGSSEFEFGSLPKALKAMRKLKSAQWMVRTIAIDDRVAYLVGADEATDVASQFLADQLKPQSQRQGTTKEWTGILGTYCPESRDAPHYHAYHGWWSIDEDLPPFILFKQKDHAEAWLGAL